MYTIQSSAMEFKNHKIYEYTLAGRPLVIETGKLAGLLTAIRHHRNQSGGINDPRTVSLIELQVIHP